MYVLITSRGERAVLFYRVRVLGEPRGPWRRSRRQAERDAVALNVGSFADDGRCYLDVLATIEDVHEYELMRRDAAERSASNTTTLAQEPQRQRRRA
jgi:hypothetical protein